MEIEELKRLVQEIVKLANSLKNKHTNEKDALVNYACIFSQSQEEYEELLKLAKKLGKVLKETQNGPLLHIEPLETVAGKLQLLKIRAPDITRQERGDADFTISNYPEFKEKVLSKKGFKLIKREHMEMMELVDKEFNVRAYFSYPPLDEQLNLNR
jgi:hypothetical protein